MLLMVWVVWLVWWRRAERLLVEKRFDEADEWNNASASCVPIMMVAGMLDSTVGIELLCWMLGV